ncbi:MAG: S49 family peptidase [Candidatus Omnitrophica bacterium]|nr:S49 family peptidase [Candidatus Omnitrophota bacterium]
MSSVAGSGGYWISMDADAIVAATTTITGSIGVVFTKFNMNGFMDWIGMNVDKITTAPLADLFGTAPLDPERRKLVEGVMGTLYDSFKTKVADGRGRTPEEIETVARGRIWSGRDALDRGLVDRIGGFDEALVLAKEKAGLDPDKDYPLRVYPKPKSFIQRLLEGDLTVKAPALPSQAALRDWAEENLRAEVLVRMPDVRVW